jgi:hypothetical protein
MEDQEKPLSLVLFSGTDDKLTAASVLAVGGHCSTRPTGTRSRMAGFPNPRRMR